jgi:hypothetical protein
MNSEFVEAGEASLGVVGDFGDHPKEIDERLGTEAGADSHAENGVVGALVVDLDLP